MADQSAQAVASCVVAPAPLLAQACAGRLREAGASEVLVYSNGPGAPTLVAWFGTVDGARTLTAQLRAEGEAAVMGPLSKGAWTAWQHHTSPILYADRCCVCFPWSIFDREKYDEIVEIDPGAGFGAGRHPSTTLLLEWLADLDLAQSRVLDVGCGSGVLAIVAAVRGADVTAIDTELAAVSATTANSSRNGVGQRVACSPTPIEKVRPPFDLILANIHAPVLTAMAGEFDRLLESTGRLLLSGVSRAQVSILERAMLPLRVQSVRSRDDWVALELTKNADDPGATRTPGSSD